VFDRFGQLPLWQIICCCACAILILEDFITGVLGKACAGARTSADFWACHIDNAITGVLNKAGFDNLIICMGKAKSKGDVAGCLGVAALKNLAKYASCMCCAGPLAVIVAVKVPKFLKNGNPVAKPFPIR